MMILDKFVFLHFPKTGGNFIRMMLAELRDRQASYGFKIRRTLIRKTVRTHPFKKVWRSLMLKSPLAAGKKFSWVYCKSEQYWAGFPPLPHLAHAGLHQLNESLLLNKRLLLSIRNPFAQQASIYRFTCKLRNLDASIPQLEEPYRSMYREYCGNKPYRELTFEEHTKFNYEIKCPIQQKTHCPSIKNIQPIGYPSLLAILYIAPNPQQVLKMPTDEFFDFFSSGGYKKWKFFDQFDFVHTENLKLELYQFLLGLGYPEHQIAFILHGQPVNTTNKNTHGWENLYNDELRRYVFQKNRILFDMFPEYEPEANGMKHR